MLGLSVLWNMDLQCLSMIQLILLGRIGNTVNCKLCDRKWIFEIYNNRSHWEYDAHYDGFTHAPRISESSPGPQDELTHSTQSPLAQKLCSM